MTTVLPTFALRAGVEKLDDGSDKLSDSKGEGSTLSIEIQPLGEPVPIGEAKRLFWNRRRKNPEGIATQPSVFDDEVTCEIYRPPPQWENTHRFDPLFRWTWGEESASTHMRGFLGVLISNPQRLVRKIDFRIMVWAWIMFFSLDLDRTNISQANTDNFLGDLHMTTDDFNLGNTLFKVSYIMGFVHCSDNFATSFVSSSLSYHRSWYQNVSVSHVSRQAGSWFSCISTRPRSMDSKSGMCT